MAKLCINRAITRGADQPLSWYMTGDAGVSYDDVDAFLSSLPAGEGVDVEIYSCGGDCTEGFAIYDALRACGRELSATVIGECASMATVLLLCAPRERRRAYKHARFLMHDPYYPDAICGDVTLQRLEGLREGLLVDRQRLRDIYVERTGQPVAVVDAQMTAGTWFDVARAQELGLVAEVVAETAAAAGEQRISTTVKIDEAMKKENKDGAVARAWRALGAALGIERSAALALTATDGTALTIDIDDGDDLAVGVSASPDGVFTLDDGRTITIAGGVITEISAPVEGGDPVEDDGDDHEARIAELEAIVKELREQLAEMTAKQKTPEEEETLAAVQRLGGVAALKGMPVAQANLPKAEVLPSGESNVFARLLAEKRNV